MRHSRPAAGGSRAADRSWKVVRTAERSEKGLLPMYSESRPIARIPHPNSETRPLRTGYNGHAVRNHSSCKSLAGECCPQTPSKKSRISGTRSRGPTSSPKPWRAPGKIVSRCAIPACSKASARTCDWATGTSTSSSPCTRKTGGATRETRDVGEAAAAREAKRAGSFPSNSAIGSMAPVPEAASFGRSVGP